MPGEWYSPTQPHPPASLMYGRNALNEDARGCGCVRACKPADTLFGTDLFND